MTQAVGGTSLRLTAEDGADLEIISAAMQDALVRMSEIAFDAKARRFTLQARRFRWESEKTGPPYERVHTVLAFESILSVKSRHVRHEASRALASILSITFDASGEPPGGTVRILLAGGGEIALEAECLDALLIDVGQPWRTPRRPDHTGAD